MCTVQVHILYKVSTWIALINVSPYTCMHVCMCTYISNKYYGKNVIKDKYKMLRVSTSTIILTKTISSLLVLGINRL